MRIFKKHSWVLLVGVVALYFIFLHLFSFAATSKIGTDVVSWVLPADSLLNGRGAPYKDYWDTKPSGIILFLSIWTLLIGKSIHAFRLLHVSLICICVFGIVRLYYKIFPRVLFAGLSILTIIVFLSPRIQTQFLTIELFALSFVLVGLNILVTEKVSFYKRGFWSAFLILFGGQIKESYAPTILSLIPFVGYVAVLYKSQLKKTIIHIALGLFSCLFLLMVFLLLNNSLLAYLEVLRYLSKISNPSAIEKAIEFPKSTFIYLQYPMLLFFLVTLIVYLYSKYKLKEIDVVTQGKKGVSTLQIFTKLTPRIAAMGIAIFYSVGSWAGFMIQNRFSSHYDIQMVFPIMILISVSTYLAVLSISRYVLRKKRSISSQKIAIYIISIVVLIIAFPKKEYFVEYPYKEATPAKFLSNLKVGQNPDLSLEKAIQAHTKPTECILHVYGWGVGTTYFYAQRKPCSRFFLVNLVSYKFENEYKTSLINNPPAAIVYTLGGADMDTATFEKNVFNFHNVVAACYRQDASHKELYLPRLRGEALKSCILGSS